MNRTTLGFWVAALYNTCIIIFSKGFGDDLGAVDPLFGSAGCVAPQGAKTISCGSGGTAARQIMAPGPGYSTKEDHKQQVASTID